MGFYGLRDGRVAAFAVHRTAVPSLPADPRAALRAVHGGLGWIAPRALAACPEDVYYDEVVQTELPRWSTGRVVLVGDASQAVSLLGGQGASVGIAGSWLLTRHLTNARTVEEALGGWERAWRPVVVEKQRVARRAPGRGVVPARFPDAPAGPAPRAAPGRAPRARRRGSPGGRRARGR
jgi:2-polyprenyl-6-methoxyphenol hydroxylase-like FAD-dependent oxidoreductase